MSAEDAESAAARVAAPVDEPAFIAAATAVAAVTGSVDLAAIDGVAVTAGVAGGAVEVTAAAQTQCRAGVGAVGAEVATVPTVSRIAVGVDLAAICRTDIAVAERRITRVHTTCSATA